MPTSQTKRRPNDAMGCIRPLGNTYYSIPVTEKDAWDNVHRQGVGSPPRLRNRLGIISTAKWSDVSLRILGLRLFCVAAVGQ